MTMKTPKAIDVPNLDDVKDPATHEALKQLVNIMEGNHKDYYEDLAIRIITIVDADATPDVSNGVSYKTANTGATTITSFDNGYPGQKITITFGDTNTTINETGNIDLDGITTRTFKLNEVVRFSYDGTKWRQVSSSSRDILTDADGDTKIQVEESSDEDKIRFDTGGTERLAIDSTGMVGMQIENRTSDPGTPKTAQVWFRSDL